MCESAICLELIKTIPVILGGGLAITGGVAGQYLAHYLSGRREQSKLLREKAEELIGLLYEHKDWVARENSRLVFGNDIPEIPSPLDRAYAIQALHFPELANSLRNISIALMPVSKLYFEEAQRRIKDKEDWIAKFDNEKLKLLYGAYLASIHVAIREVGSSVGKRVNP